MKKRSVVRPLRKQLGLPRRRHKSERQEEVLRLQAIRAHDCKRSKCGPVCTFGDW